MSFPSVVLCCLLPVVQDPEPLEGPALRSAIEAFVAPLVAREHLSGTLLVARGEQVLLEQSWGLANRELDVPNRPDTKFCIASITKPMTVAIAVRLLETMKLGYQDKLAKWIPDFPRGDEITIEHLLRHRAGISHRVTSAAEEAVPRSAAEMVELAKRKPLVFAPGARSGYSSGGFSVLARVLELASGKSYAELLQDLVCGPAGLAHTLHGDSRMIMKNRASSYRFSTRGVVNAALKDTSFLVGAGSVWSTPRDLFRLQRAILAGKLGPSVKGSLERREGMRWNGVTNGFRAFADHHRDVDLTVVLTSNQVTGANDLLREAVPRLVAGEKVAPPEIPDIEPVTISGDILQRYAGTYQMRPGSDLDVRPEDGVLYANDWVLIPTSESSFFSPQDYGRVTIETDENGVPQRLMWARPGQEPTPMPRVGG